MKKLTLLFVIIIVGLIATRFVDIPKEPVPTKTEAIGELYAVTHIIDGDTIIVDKDGKEEKVRLLGIDTPEVDETRGPVECFGKEASAKTDSLLAGQSVYLETDPSQAERDKYNRLLAYVYTQDGALVNKILVEGGYAREYTYDKPYTYQADFQVAEKSARDDKRGLWSKGNCPN
jgi:micrococcal nuclease